MERNLNEKENIEGKRFVFNKKFQLKVLGKLGKGELRKERSVGDYFIIILRFIILFI